jgi:hypothetical protein
LEIQTAIKGSVVGIKELEDGKILTAAVTNNPPSVALIRLTADGTYDSTFNETGHILHQDNRVAWPVDYGDALFLNDGSVVIVAKALSSGVTRALIFKLNANGSLNQDFGVNGILEITGPIQYNFAGIHAARHSDEHIRVATTSAESPKKYRVTKVFADTGTLDSEFGEDGTAISSNGASFNAVHHITVNPDNGDIYVAGTGSNSDWSHSIWKIDSSGNEQDICDGSSFYTFPQPFTNGIRSAEFFSDGTLKLVGESSTVDETSSTPTNQNVNFTVIKSDSLTGLNDIDHSVLSLYPNPAMDILNIKTTNLTIESIRIRNQLGQIVLSSNSTGKSVDIAQLTPGIYFIEVSSSKGVAIRKLVKQ